MSANCALTRRSVVDPDVDRVERRESVINESVEIELTLLRLDLFNLRTGPRMPRGEDGAAVLIRQYRGLKSPDLSRDLDDLFLVKPDTGSKTGILTTESVTAIARIVWLATCARLSPVISAPQLLRLATFSARVIIKRRRSSVK